jgi:hypothetical protein
MNDLAQLLRKWKWLLLILPLFYFAVAAYFRMLMSNPSLRSVDPEYIYFISGLGIAEGHLKIGHIDNPGTPLQYLIAIVFRVIYLFRPGNAAPFTEDVLSNPDLYMATVNVVITGLTVFAMYLTGKYIYRKSGSVLYAVLVQTLPLLPVIWYDLIGRITPELLFPFPLFALSALLVKYLFQEETDWRISDLAIFSVVSGFGLSIKLSYISLWIIPLIIIRPWKKKLIFVGMSVASFFLIALPVTLQISTFWSWVKALFLHSGTYGSGEEKIIDLVSFKANITELINLEKFFFWLWMVLLIWGIATFIFFRRNLKWKGLVLCIALLVAIFIQFILTGKHYAHRYFIPALMLAPIMVLLSAEWIRRTFLHRLVNTGLSIALVLFLGWTIQRQFAYIRMKSEAIGGQVNARIETWHVVSTIEKESIRIIVSQDYGSPFKEYALLYSTAWAANKLKPHYTECLLKLYPNTYQYTTWNDKFQHWGDLFDPTDILKKDLPVYVYLEKKSDELLNTTIAKLDPKTEFDFNWEEIFLNKNNSEVIYQLKWKQKSNEASAK